MLLRKTKTQNQSIEIFASKEFQFLTKNEMQKIYGGRSIAYEVGVVVGQVYCAIKADITKDRPAVENPTALELCTA